MHKMDGNKKRIPDYTDIAYREAVSRLRYMLADSYNSSPYRSLSQGYARGGEPDSGGEDTVIERTRALLSPYRRPVYTARRTLFPSAARSPSRAHVSPAAPSVHVQEPHEVHTAPATPRASAAPEPAATSSGTLPPEMMAYIERQEEYIDQLERESQFCRDELSGLLGKVKEVISENEGLQERQKSGVLRSVLDYLQPSDREDEEEDDDTEASEAEPRRKKAVQRSQRRMEGPSIVYESRISELEAQLTQVRIDLKKSQDETDLYKRRLLGEGLPLDSNEPDTVRHQLDQLKRERSELAENVAKLQSAATQLRERESEATHRLKRAQETAEQVQFERTQSELEVRRLKEELDRLHARLREAVAEQGRRAAEERASVERRYQQQLEQLQSDLASQWDASGRLQLELEKQRRTEAELRRDLACKSATLDEMAKETQAKIDVLQGQLHASLAQHSMLSQELAAAQLQADRAEREGRAESSRLEAEVSALRERLDRADSETLRARQEALRLSEQLAALDREMTLSKIKGVSSEQQPPPALREQELMKMVSSMQEKHVETVAELEGMIESQNQVMAKLKDECHTLTQRLEDSSARHKQERQLLREENDMLLNSCEVLRAQVEDYRHQQQPSRPSQEQAQVDEMVGLQSNIDYLTSKLEASLEAQGQREVAQHYEPEVSGLEDSVYQEPSNRGVYQPPQQQSTADYMESSPTTEGRGVVESAQSGHYPYKSPERASNYETSQRVGKFEPSEGTYQGMESTPVSRSPSSNDAERTRGYEQTASAYQQPARTASRNQSETTRANNYEPSDTSSIGGVDQTRRDNYEPAYQRSPSREALVSRDSSQEQPRPAAAAGKYNTSETNYKPQQEFQSSTGYEATSPMYERGGLQSESPSKSYPYTESPSKTSYPATYDSPTKQTYQSTSPYRTESQPTTGPYTQQTESPSKSYQATTSPYPQQSEFTSKPSYQSTQQSESPSKSSYPATAGSYNPTESSPSKQSYQSTGPYTESSQNKSGYQPTGSYNPTESSPSKQSYQPTGTSPNKTSYQPTGSYNPTESSPNKSSYQPTGSYSQQSESSPSKQSYQPTGSYSTEYASKPTYPGNGTYTTESTNKPSYQSTYNPQQSEQSNQSASSVTYPQSTESVSKPTAPRSFTKSPENNKSSYQSGTQEPTKTGSQSNSSYSQPSPTNRASEATEKQQRPPSAGSRTSPGSMRGRGSASQRTSDDRK
ncbi:hypothetical protein B566_EDAN010382 [Ephemera danica]|nr:hypothetical protein B566_EDAN010382 [Ephemera danica]